MSDPLTSLYDQLTLGAKTRLPEEATLPFLVLLILSVLSSVFISLLYLRYSTSRITGSEIHRAFPLLGLSVTAIFICIQFSLPLSLGLLGALSIVRFRTPIKEPEEIGFLMLVIAAALACATANVIFLAVILAVASLALIARRAAPRFLGGSTTGGSLVVCLATDEAGAKAAELLAFLASRLPRVTLDSVTSRDGEVALAFGFRSAPSETLLRVETELRREYAPTTVSLVSGRPQIP